MALSNIPTKQSPVFLGGQSFSPAWYKFLFDLYYLFQPGYTGTIVTAKITPAGANGSMTFQNGVLVKQVAAT